VEKIMRGLHTRALLAQAKVMTSIGALSASQLFDKVTQLAEADGLTDAANGVATAPVMFNDEPTLQLAWQAGQARYARGLDRSNWHGRCENMATAAYRGCGLSHDLYVERFSKAVDLALQDLYEHERTEAVAIARHFDYATEEEIDQGREDRAEYGYCRHGIELGCCPAGCE
jgi:hypothetical protein